MDEDRNQGRSPKQQVKRKRPLPWRQTLNPNREPGQNTSRQSDAQIEAEWTAFHLRKRGLDSAAVNDEVLERGPAPRNDRSRR